VQDDAKLAWISSGVAIVRVLKEEPVYPQKFTCYSSVSLKMCQCISNLLTRGQLKVGHGLVTSPGTLHMARQVQAIASKVFFSSINTRACRPSKRNPISQSSRAHSHASPETCELASAYLATRNAQRTPQHVARAPNVLISVHDVRGSRQIYGFWNYLKALSTRLSIEARREFQSHRIRQCL